MGKSAAAVRRLSPGARPSNLFQKFLDVPSDVPSDVPGISEHFRSFSGFEEDSCF